MDNTGKIDQLIEQKVNGKIDVFARKIAAQIDQFLQENGESGDYLYQAEGFELFNSGYQPTTYGRHRLYGAFLSNLKGGLELSVKDKMITKETKELLEKIELLS